MRYHFVLLFAINAYALTARAQHPVGKCDSSLNLINYTTTISGIYNPLWNYHNALENFTLTAYGDLYSGSNSITTNFLKNIYYNGFIDTELKNTVSDNLEDINRVGVTVFNGAGFTYAHKKLFQGKMALTGGLEHVMQQTADFTPDVFHLIFYGNYDLQDSVANLDNTSFNGIKYNKYRIGLIKPYFMGDSALTASAMLSLVQGVSSNFINIKSGAFYTAPLGEFIDFVYDFQVTNTPPDSSIFDWQGTGAALDLFFEYYWPKTKTKFSFIANDLGFVNWNKGTKKLTGDTSIHFEGVDINDLLNATSTVFTQDTIYQLLGLHETSLAFSRMLPVKLNTAFVKEFSSTFYALLGVQHIFNNTYTPLVYIKAGRIFTGTGTAIDGILEYGGYGGLNFGFGAVQRINKNASVHLNASNFLGLIVPDKLTGAALYIMVQAAF